MPIENRNLEPGTKLFATYKKETYHALVVAGEDGKVKYQLSPDDGKEYKSPSSLGTAVTGKSCNGWNFWSVDTDAASEETTDTAQMAETEVTTTADSVEEDVVEGTYVTLEEEGDPTTTQASFRKVPNQKGVDAGQVRLHCYECRSSFIVPDDRNPETCPAGHSPS